MDEIILRTKLDELYRIRQEQSRLQEEKQGLIDNLTPPLPPSVEYEIGKVREKFAPNEQRLQVEASKLDAEIRAGVVEVGHSVTGVGLRGTFVRGFVKWNGEALDGYAAAYPEIKQFRSEGKPLCWIEGK